VYSGAGGRRICICIVLFGSREGAIFDFVLFLIVDFVLGIGVEGKSSGGAQVEGDSREDDRFLYLVLVEIWI
jgi:hypothetical protein